MSKQSLVGVHLILFCILLGVSLGMRWNIIPPEGAVIPNPTALPETSPIVHLTKQELRQLIREEVVRALAEQKVVERE